VRYTRACTVRELEFNSNPVNLDVVYFKARPNPVLLRNMAEDATGIPPGRVEDCIMTPPRPLEGGVSNLWVLGVSPPDGV